MHLSTAANIFSMLVAVAAAEMWRAPDFITFQTCSFPGQRICSNDCSQVQLCVTVGDDVVPTVVEECDLENNMKCSITDEACVATLNSDCHEVVVNFTCNDAGAFPDPYDCTTYHVCLQAGAYAADGRCTGDWAYNPDRYDCSLRHDDRVCTDGPIDGCRNAGDIGVVPENPSIYYICIRVNGVLYPNMYKCHHGQVFDTSIVGCVDDIPDEPTDQPTDGPDVTTTGIPN